MLDFDRYLEEKLKNPDFARGFDEELRLARMAVDLAVVRDKKGLTQSGLAKKSGITQQQLSRLENACSCNVRTLMKVCDALGLELALRPKRTDSAITPAKPRRSRAKSSPRPKRRATA
jgi:DNA-binding phage protein